MFALPGVKISNLIIELASMKAMKIIFFSDFNEHTTPLLSKAEILKFIDLIKWRTVFLLINLYQVLYILYSSKCINLRMITITTILDLHQMFF